MINVRNGLRSQLLIRFYEPETLATAILYFNVYMNYHLSLALRVSLLCNEPET